MRIIYLIAALFSVYSLVACTPQPTKPRIVKMPELLSKYTEPLIENCVWQSESLEVFNQPSQTLSFRFQDCGVDSREKEEFFFKDTDLGGVIFEKYYYDASTKVKRHQETGLISTAAKPIKGWRDVDRFRIWKQGALTPDDFFGRLMGENFECELFPHTDNQYIIVKSDFRNKGDFEIIPDEPAAEFLARYNMYESINRDGWGGPHVCKGLRLNLMVFADGIVYSLPSSSSIDFQSITYTNKG